MYLRASVVQPLKLLG